MNYRIIFLCCILFCSYGCKQTYQEESESVLKFVRTDFRETIYLNEPKEIIIEDLLNVAVLRVMRDSILVVGNQPNCEYLLELYSLNNICKPLKQLVRKGTGPSEMISCVLGLYGNDDRNFLLTDYNTGICNVVNMNVLLKDSPFEPLYKFKYSSEISDNSNVCMVNDSSYVGYNRWYLPNSKFSSIGQPLSYYKCDANEEKIEVSPYYMDIVNGCGLLYNYVKGQIWGIENHRDLIHIYDDSLQLINTLMGPDHYLPQYEDEPLDPQNVVVRFADRRNYRTYCDYYLTSKHVYLVYAGTDSYDDMNLNPVEIFKLDHEGNLLYNYKMDRYL